MAEDTGDITTQDDAQVVADAIAGTNDAQAVADAVNTDTGNEATWKFSYGR